MSVGSTFQDAFERSSTKPTGPDSTWNGFTKIVPQQRIDFIFITNSVEVLQLRTIDDQREGRFPSDHLPVWSEIAIKK
jgi:endonuclease/exonuclease/phosphatase family metal-dependent hydrolase